jgi:hypothetical protein
VLKYLHRVWPILLVAASLGGCTPLNYMLANLAPDMPGPKVEAQYKDLNNRSVAVVIFADMNVRFEYPTVREEVAGAINRELEATLKKVRTIDAAQVVRFQDAHPGWRNEPLGDLGKKFGADSVLYVCLSEFALQERGSLSLPKGRISGQLSVWDSMPLKEGEDPCRWRQDSISSTTEPPAGTWMDRARLRQATQQDFAVMVVNNFHSYHEKNDSNK